MPLNLGPAPERSRTPAILISVAVLAIVAAAIYHFSPRTPAQLHLGKVDLFAPHTEVKAAKGGVHILGTPGYTEDNLYVVVHLTITNRLGVPLFLNSPEATLTTPQGASGATVVNPSDVQRLELSFPALTPLVTNPIGSESQIAPHATIDGSVILLFPTLTADAWKSKSSAALTINLHNLPPQTINLP